MCVCYVWPRPSSNRTNSAVGNLQSRNPLKLSRKDGAARRPETAEEQQTEQKGDVPIQEFCICSGSPDCSAVDFFSLCKAVSLTFPLILSCTQHIFSDKCVWDGDRTLSFLELHQHLSVRTQQWQCRHTTNAAQFDKNVEKNTIILVCLVQKI